MEEALPPILELIKDADSNTVYVYNTEEEVGTEVNAYSDNILMSKVHKDGYPGTFYTFFSKNNKILIDGFETERKPLPHNLIF